eukprot:TRINITY_DN7122_c0_g1_i2.p1 TRINITY_DN7122_c0_g1~~TRINITY_DN7122_c0_g1_i2.p1  ORF type:complete len:209 (+),score=21.40 TRINITY_DN7122_c0_g1_i2:36-629(+)
MNLGRYGVLFSATIITYMLWSVFHTHQTGWAGHWKSMAVGICFHIFDYLTSDATSENLKTMEKNGISRLRALGTVAFNVMSGTLFPAIVVIYWVGPVEYRFDLSLVFTVLICLAVSEVLFYYSHQYLHRNLPHLHLMHHCCKRSSFTTNSFFHPLDLVMEFTGPVVSLFVLTLYVFNDPFAFLVGLAILTTWYVERS